MKGKVKIKTKMKAVRRVAACALLLALLLPGAIALSQDSFFYIEEEVRDQDMPAGTSSWLGFGDNTGGDASWLNFGENTGGEATWEGFEEGNPLPTGAGLLALTVSGLCYAGLKRRRDSKI